MKRTLNIISRAINDFGLEVDMNDTMQDVLDKATNAIIYNVDYDYISECERGAHYDHISWNDGKGFDLEADGEFISSDDRLNRYFRKDDKDEFSEIAWYDHTADDYVLMEMEVDTDGMKAALVCK